VTLRIRLLVAMAYVLVLAIVAFGVPLAINLRARVNAEVRTQAQAQADLVAATATDLLRAPDRIELSGIVRKAAASVRGRILVVNATGRVLVDSAGSGDVGVSYASRPEIQAALLGHQVQVQRSSQTLGQEILATAVPLIRNRRPIGAVRVTQSVKAVNSAVRRAILGLAILGAAVLALGLLAGAVVAAQVARPIRRLEQVARRVAGGDLLARAKIEGSSEQRSLAGSFNDMTDRIAGLLRRQREFVTDASHQLRTPLTGLRLRLEEAKALESGSASADLDAAICEVDRLSHTVNELLVLSGAGERQLIGGTVDLHEVAASAVERWQPHAADSGIVLRHRGEPGDGSTWAARPDIERALDALVENSLRYSPSGTAVKVVSRPGRIEVLDRGPGIREEERELVFERFHRGDTGRAGPAGSGLGLAIARELAREWGGDVTLSPRAGGGATATLSVGTNSRSSASPGSTLQGLNVPASTV
jgi:signal transduction histidine kinase